MKPNINPSRTCLALSAAGLLALASGLSARADYSSTVMSYSPSAYWRLNETTPMSLDLATNSGTAGQAGLGYYFNGATHGVAGIPGAGSDTAANIPNPNNGGNMRIRVPYTPALNAAGPFTVEFWCNPAVGGTGGTPVSSVDFNNSRGWLFYDGASVSGNWTFRVYTGSGNVSITTGTIVRGQWHHVVGTYDGANMSLYVDNVLLGTKAVTYAPVSNPSIPFTMGCRADGQAGIWAYTGGLDEVVFYTNVLSATDIQNHYQAGTNSATANYSALITPNNPVGYWRLNEPAYVAPDPSTLPIAANLGSVGASARGTYLPFVIDGVAGPGYAGLGGATVSAFNASQGYINCGTNVPVLSEPLNQITVMTWAKLSTTRAMDWESIITCGDTAWELQRPNNDYSVSFRFAGQDLTTPSTRPINDGQWHHIAATYDGVAQKVYLDGSLAASVNRTLTGAGETTYPILIGENGRYPGRILNGNLAEMAVFTTALSASDIQTIYNSAQVPPVITSQPQAPSPVYESDSVNLAVQAVGASPLAYQWTKGGASLSGKTNSSLALNNVTLSDSGNYAVVIANAYGSVTSSVAVLTVQASKPLIVSQPVSRMGFIGAPATFAVAARGSAPISYQWKKNGNPISGATASSYTLASVQWSDAASYACTLSNTYGTSNSTTVTLTVVGDFAGGALPETDYRDRHTALGSDGASIYFTRGTGGGAGFYRMAEGLPTSWSTLASVPTPATWNTDAGLGDMAYYGGALWMMGRASDASSARGIYFYNVAADSWTVSQFTTSDGPNSAIAVLSETNILGAWAGLGPTATLKRVTNWTNGILADVGDLGGSFSHAYDACVGPTAAYYIKHNYNYGAGPYGVLDSVAKTGNTITSIAGMPFNPGVGCAVEYLPGSFFADTHARLFVLRGGGTGTRADGWDWSGAVTTDQLAVYDLTAQTWSLASLPFAVDEGSEMCLVNQDLYILAANGVPQPLKVLRLGTAVTPVVTAQPAPQTIFEGQSATFSVSGVYGGGPCTYQWRLNGVAIPGATGATLTVANADYVNAANYDVVITNPAGNTTSVPASLTVLPPPAFANLTNGLIIHLKFDGDVNDASGNGNNATAFGMPSTFVPGKLGQGIELKTDTTAGTYNYLQVFDPNGTFNYFGFDVTNSFSIALWIKYTNAFYDLPVLGNASHSTYNPGYCLTENGGQFAWTIHGMNGAGAVDADPVGGPLLNDGAWHQLTLVLNRDQGVIQSFVDGMLIDTRAGGVGSLVTYNALTLGQDPTGAYGVSGMSDMDDFGLWSRALTPTEAESIYMVGQKGLSYDTIAPIKVEVRKNGGKVQVIWQDGTLQWADDVNGTWSNVPSAAAPYYYYTPAAGAGKKFFRVR